MNLVRHNKIYTNGARVLISALQVFVLLLTLSACGGGGGGGDSLAKRSVDPSIVPQDAIEVTNVQYSGDKLQVTGKNLDRVTSVTLRGKDAPGTKQLYIGSKSFGAMEVWQATLPALEIISSKIFELVISTAHGQAIIPLTFILQDNAVTTVKLLDGAVTNPKLAAGAVTLDKIGDVGAADGDVIKWDDVAGQWIVAADDAGAGGGGTVTSITRGNGLVNSGTSLTTTGTIAVDTGSGPSQILKLDASGDLELDGIVEINSIAPNGGVISFVDNTREFRMFNDGSLRIHDLTDTTDRFVIDSTGTVSITGDTLISGSVTMSGLNYPTADGSSGQVLSTNGAGVLAWISPVGGDITSVTAGTGLTGGGASGDVTLTVDTGTTTGKIVAVGAGNKIPVALIPTAIDAANINTGVVSNTEFNYLDGVTAAIQTQFSSITPVPAPGADSNFLVSNGTSWVTETGATARASLGVSIGTQVQSWDDDLDDISSLTPGNNYFLVGDGTNWTSESPSTARSSLGLGTMSTQNDSAVAITGGTAQLTTVTALNQGQVQWREQVGNGAQYAAIQAPAAITTSYTLTLPTGTGGSGQNLSTDGSGNLVWSTDGGGDITGVTAGTGLTGGGTSGDVTLNVDVGTGNGQIVQAGAGDKIAVSLIPTAIPAASVGAGSVDNTELGYLDGATSAIQTQLGTKVNKAGDTMSGLLRLQTSAVFEDPGAGSFAATLQAPTLAASYVLTLPVDDGTSGQLLQTDGAGVLAWVTGAAPTGSAGGDLTGTYPNPSIAAGVIVDADINASAGIVDTKLATIATAGKVSNSATTATNANTASAIVARDASGNFSAGTITAALTGAASSNVLKAGDTMSGLLRLQTSAVFEDPGAGAFATTIQSATLAANYVLTLPVDDGTTGQLLQTDGAGVLSWISGAAPTGSAGGDLTGTYPNPTIAAGVIVDADINASAAITATKIAGGTVDNTEFSYVNGVTGAIQTQIDTKVNKAGDTMSGLLRLQTSAVFEDPGAGAFATTIQSATLAANYVLTLPVDDGTTGQLLQTDGAGVLSWISGAAPTGSAGGDLTGTYPNPSIAAGAIVDADINASAAITATKIAGGTVDNTEFSYVNGVTGAIQTQLGTKLNKAGDTMTGELNMNAQNIIKFKDSDSSNFVGLRSPATVLVDLTWTLPAADGLIGQVLSTNGTGTLSWVTPAGTGDITGVAAGTGLTGGGVSGDVTLNVDVGTGNGQIVQAGAGDKIAVSLIPTAIPAASIGAGSVDNTELGYLDGATAAIQTQLGTKVNKAGDTMSGLLRLQTSAVFEDPGAGAFATTIQSATLAANYVLTLPVDDGTTGQLLQTDGAGVLSWVSGAAPTGSAGGDLTGTYPNPSIAAGVIVDADINASAAITWSKMANLSNDTALYSNASGDVTSLATVSSTELGYLDGVTGALQTQLGTKLNKAGDSMTGELNMNAQNIVKYRDADSTNFAGLRAPATITTDFSLTLPTALPGANGSALVSDTSGNITYLTSMPPSGSASGDLTGSYPGPSIAAGVIVDADINASAAITATKLAGGTVDNTEFGYINGVTGAIQTQIDSKVNKAGDTMTGNLVAPIMYDYNSTSYYVDPASTSNVNTITATAISVGGSAVCLASGTNCYIPSKIYTATNSYFIGSNSGTLNAADGYYNHGFGSNALAAITTGDRNVAIGINTLQSLVSGSDNIGIGYALANATSSYNIGIGTYTSNAITTGAYNISLGYQSLNNNNIGSYNTAVGHNSQNGVGSGSGNTSMGYNALTAITTSYYNTSIGYNSLLSVSTGSYNVALGGSAGAGVTTGASNVFIGYNAGPGSNVSNSLYIDNSQTTTPLIHGDFSGDKATINGTFEVDSTGGMYVGNATANGKMWFGPASNMNYIESANDAWTGNATLNLTGWNGNQGSTLNVNFATNNLYGNTYLLGTSYFTYLYDNDNTAYYIDPNGTTRLNYLYVDGASFWSARTIYKFIPPASFQPYYDGYDYNITVDSVSHNATNTAYFITAVPMPAYATATSVTCYFLDGNSTGYSNAYVYESTSTGSVYLGNLGTSAAENSASVYTKTLDITDTYLDSNDGLVIYIGLYNSVAGSQDFRGCRVTFTSTTVGP